MAGVSILLSIIAIILLTLSQTVYVEVLRDDEFIIIIDVLLFKVILYPERKKKKEKTTIRERISNFILIKRVLIYTFSRSHVFVNHISLPVHASQPHKAAELSGAVTVVLTTLIAYASVYSKSISVNSVCTPIEKSFSSFHFSLSLRILFFDLLLTLLYYYKEARENKRRMDVA